MMSTTHLHPMLVHFPIALTTLGFVAEVASLYFKKELCLPKVGFYLLIVGTLASIVAVFSGLVFTNEMSGAADEIRDLHQVFAWLTVSFLLATSLLRIYLLRNKTENANLKWIAFAMYGIATICVSITGFFGGTLVYNYMMPL